MGYTVVVWQGGGYPGVWWVAGSVDAWWVPVVRVRVRATVLIPLYHCTGPTVPLYWSHPLCHCTGPHHCTGPTHCTTVPATVLVPPTVPLYRLLYWYLYHRGTRSTGRLVLYHRGTRSTDRLGFRPSWLPLVGYRAGGSRGLWITCRSGCGFVEQNKRRFMWK